ncbi:EAL domain-containing protein [Novosphingobium sp. M1R2S20]|uniref:EAL domain-containing protein n=1 Tax=Novosphingobium rhizovicinum TaxID=3228928 RepID=A0ABV3RGM2_9SPHN
MTDLIARLRAAWRNRRSRIVASALLIGAVCGVLDVAMPLEDLFIAARTKLRYEKADGSIVVVKIDDRTLSVLHDNDVSPALDARLIEKLMRAGATEIYFGRTYPFSRNSTGARELIRTLEKYSGRVYFGAASRADDRNSKILNVLPDDVFRSHAGMVSLAALSHPLNLSFSFPFSSPSPTGPTPSLAAAMANVGGEGERMFRANFAIDHKTIPTMSYIDVINGNFDKREISGKKVVLGITSSMTEFRPLPLGDFAPGVYFHVIAAQTLRMSVPLDLGWIPPYLIVAVLIATGIGRGRSFTPYRLIGYAIIVGAVPAILDYFSIAVEVIPAAVMAVYATLRARTLDKMKDASETNAASGLPSFQALRGIKDPVPGLLVALKIRNYSGIIRSFSESVEAELAGEIQRRIRISEKDVTVYHEGGMFVWISGITDIVDLFENLEGLHRIAQNGIALGKTEVDVGFNCGIDAEPQNTLANRLANAMQSAEEAVRSDELVCHRDGKSGEVQWEISLLTSLDRAIDNGEVWVAFQPKVDISSNRLVGAEALARWTHPERGAISPDKFISIAEEYHRIERITRFVLNHAVSCASSLARQDHEFSVSVNISAQLLRNPSLFDMVSETLMRHSLPADRLILEITETDRLDRSKKSLEMMESLVKSGVRISIDDFGTGNATIDYLRYLPASEVKIDKLFIREIETNPDDRQLVQSIIEMAHSLRRKVVAEGVETKGALQLLGQLHCDQAQGYYVGKPVPFSDIITQFEGQPVYSRG